MDTEKYINLDQVVSIKIHKKRINTKINYLCWKKEGKIEWLISVQKVGQPSTYRDSYNTKTEAKIACIKKLINYIK